MNNDFEKIFNIAWNKTLERNGELPTKAMLPRGFVLGGQPGSGKSGLIKKATDICHGDIIVISGDDYRKYHPDYKFFQKEYGKDSPKYTAEFAGKMTEAILNKAVKEHYNIVIEGTFRNPATPTKTLELMKQNGYRTSVLIQTAPKEVSWKSCQERYEKMLEAEPDEARWTDKAHHDLVVESLAKNIKAVYDSGLADRMEVYCRDENNQNKMIYTSESHNPPSVKILNSYIGNIPKINRNRGVEIER